MSDSSGLEALFIRLYFDRHIMRLLAADLRGRGFDVQTTEDAKKDTATDEDQLAYATGEKRAIFTFNIRDFAVLHQLCQARGGTHSGIIVSRQLGSAKYSFLLQRMLRLLNRLSAQEMVNNFVHLEQFK